MKRRSIFIVVMLLVMAMSMMLVLASCGGEDEDKVDKDETEQEVTPPPAPDNRTKPVYLGMQVFNVNNLPSKTAKCDYHGDFDDWWDDIDDDDPFGDDDDDDIEGEIDRTLEVEGSAEKIYYAPQHEDIYIVINLNNPDSYEILSFTLNGAKYSSYMFERGSDMEHLILKLNTGDKHGVNEYTIDAIKYIVGEDIDDVDLKGDKTVKVGVQVNNQVSTPIANEHIGFDSVSFDVNVTDADGLLAFSHSKLQAILYDGKGIIAKQDLKLGNNSVEFASLKTNTIYQYAITGYYDNLSGNGIANNVLVKRAFRTLKPLTFGNIVVADDSISWTNTWHKDLVDHAITSIKLYEGENVRDIDVNATKIDSLIAGTNYKMIVSVKYNGTKTDTSTLTFSTKVNSVPTMNITSITADENAISFVTREEDIDNVGDILSIELYNGDVKVYETTNNTIREITNLEVATAYKLKLTYRYNLNDGQGNKDIIVNRDITTLDHNWLDVEYTWSTDYSQCTATKVCTRHAEHNLTKTVSTTSSKTPATCTKAGTIKYVATFGESWAHEDTKTINDPNAPALGHIEKVEITSTRHKIICTRCQSVLVDEVHHFDPNTHTCKCGAKETIIGTPDIIYEYDSALDAYNVKGFNSRSNHINRRFLEMYIPNTYNGKPVNKILDRAFYVTENNMPYQITKLVIADGITSIGREAFSGQMSMASVYIGEGMQTIADNAFTNCGGKIIVKTPSLNAWTAIDFAGSDSNPLNISGDLEVNGVAVKDLVIDSSITNIGKYAFAGNRFNSITFMSGARVVDRGAFFHTNGAKVYTPSMEAWLQNKFISGWSNPIFSECTLYIDGVELGTTVEIPAGTTEIYGSFPGAKKIRKVILPESLLIIGDDTFDGCFDLEDINLPSKLTTIGRNAFDACVSMPSINIPASTKNIDYDAFSSCQKLVIYINVDTIPDTWRDRRPTTQYPMTGGYAWNGSNRPIVYPSEKNGDRYYLSPEGIRYLVDNSNNVASIVGVEENAPLEITIHRNIEINSKQYLVSISEGRCFATNKSIKKIIFDEDTYVPFVNNEMFAGCYSLEEIVLARHMNRIGDYAFDDCYNLKYINFPMALKEMGKDPFVDSTKVTFLIENSSPVWDGPQRPIIPNKYWNGLYRPVVWNYAGEHGETADGFVWALQKDGTIAVAGYNGTSSDVVIPDTINAKSVTVIAESAFRDAKLNSLTLPTGIRHLSWRAFENAVINRPLYVPQSVTQDEFVFNKAHITITREKPMQ